MPRGMALRDCDKKFTLFLLRFSAAAAIYRI
jgi:hypothetical protein